MALLHNSPASFTQITAYENALNRTFLGDYRDFLARYNGIFIDTPLYCELPLESVEEGWIGLLALYGIDEKDALYDLVVQHREYASEIQHLKEPIIIGEDAGGNLFVQNQDGEIYYWDRTHLHSDEGCDFKECDEEGNLYYVAPSFEVFYRAILQHTQGGELVYRLKEEA